MHERHGNNKSPFNIEGLLQEMKLTPNTANEAKNLRLDKPWALKEKLPLLF